MRYVITTPEPRWTGEVAGVAFAHGTGVTADEPPGRVLNYFRRRGYGVQPVEAVDRAGPEPAEAPADPEPSARPRNYATKTAWVAYATAHGMPADEAEAMTRDQLVERFPADEGDNP